MTTYSAITSAQIDADSYIDTTVAGQWTNNVLAMFEGDASASSVRLQTAALDSTIKPWIQLASGSVSSATELDLTGLTQSYLHYRVELHRWTPATDGASLFMRVGTTNSPTWETGASDYEYDTIIQSTSGANTELNSAASSSMRLTLNTGGAAGEALSGEIHLNSPYVGSYYKAFYGTLAYINNAGAPEGARFIGGYNAGTEAISGVRFYYSTGNISSGIYILYGQPL